MNMFLLLMLMLALLTAAGILVVPAIVNKATRAMAVLMERGDSRD